jgi:hypothetical protein
VLLGRDSSFGVSLEPVAEGLNRICKHLRFVAHPRAFNLRTKVLSNPRTYEALAALTDQLLEEHSAIVVATDVPYDNNYYWDSDTNVSLLSFSGWSSLTNLPKSNGFVGLLATILSRFVGGSQTHSVTTGCVYDFMADKRGIDPVLRSGTLCRTCFARVKKSVAANDSETELFGLSRSQVLEDLTRILEEVSAASRREADIIDRWQMPVVRGTGAAEFDVFLCHNSKDKPAVRTLYRELKGRGISAWFDEEHLRPGVPWQTELEKAIGSVRSAAVLVGPHGRGPWQDGELRAFLGEFVRRECPVIPVILREAPHVPELPIFLRQFMWVDFRKEKPDPLKRLIWGITGSRSTESQPQ